MKIPVDPMRQELEAIKARQKARKEAGTPTKVTLEMLYQAQVDILENQARQENMLKEILRK
ncbi:MAG: hypothetical protein ACYC6C_12655 [Coriobacteriia bacterium]